MDCVETVDDLPTKNVIDTMHNDHGVSLIDIVLQAICVW